MRSSTRPTAASLAPGAGAVGTGALGAVRAALRGARRVLHAILGVPDYERYVRHLREHHPDCPVPSAREFERERLKARYERPGSRCC